MKLDWKIDLATSALHAAEAAALGYRFADPTIEETFRSVGEKIHVIGREVVGGPDRLWNWLLGMSSEVSGHLLLAEKVLAKLSTVDERQQSSVSQLADAVEEAIDLFGKQFPKAAEQLPHRVRPIRDAWDGFGPGLIRGVSQWIGESAIADEATIVLLYPVLGGGGGVFLSGNQVQLEAVLTNRNSQLPEVVRLAWLLSQLEVEAQGQGDLVSPTRLLTVAAYATLPVVMKAASELELTSFDADTIEMAIREWNLPPTQRNATEQVLSWWDTFQSQRPPWRIALTAMDKML